MLENVYEGLNVKNVYEGLNVKNVYEGKMHPTCVSPKLCEVICSFIKYLK